MQKEIRAPLESLPISEASFVEPMECLAVSKLPAGATWIWEILCGPPHKISVASVVMWRRDAVLAREPHKGSLNAT